MEISRKIAWPPLFLTLFYLAVVITGGVVALLVFHLNLKNNW